MLIDFENDGLIQHPILVENEICYIQPNVWGYIKGDIREQKDLYDLISNIETGLTPEQIELLSNASNIINEFKTDYYTKREVDNLISNIEVGDLTGYATEQWVFEQGYLSEATLLEDYYTKEEIDNAFNNIEIGLTPEQIELINNLDDKFASVELSISELTSELGDKASADSVYSKDETDNLLSNKLDTNKIWSGTQAEWDNLTPEQQASYIIAMIEI
jgi:hypothetical protein